ncbi:MAG: ComEA family DNA-binding protein [Pseudomonadales bacterium]
MQTIRLVKTVIFALFLSVTSLAILPQAYAAETKAGAAVSAKVNINSADAALLSDALKGVGQSKAQAIVADRKSNGPFKSVDDLTRVRGIGMSIVDKNRSLIALN